MFPFFAELKMNQAIADPHGKCMVAVLLSMLLVMDGSP